MAFKLNYKATCEYCDTSIETRAISPALANENFKEKGWETVGATLEHSQHYCPTHAKHQQSKSIVPKR